MLEQMCDRSSLSLVSVSVVESDMCDVLMFMPFVAMCTDVRVFV